MSVLHGMRDIWYEMRCSIILLHSKMSAVYIAKFCKPACFWNQRHWHQRLVAWLRNCLPAWVVTVANANIKQYVWKLNIKDFRLLQMFVKWHTFCVVLHFVRYNCFIAFSIQHYHTHTRIQLTPFKSLRTINFRRNKSQSQTIRNLLLCDRKLFGCNIGWLWYSSRSWCAMAEVASL